MAGNVNMGLVERSRLSLKFHNIHSKEFGKFVVSFRKVALGTRAVGNIAAIVCHSVYSQFPLLHDRSLPSYGRR